MGAGGVTYLPTYLLTYYLGGTTRGYLLVAVLTSGYSSACLLVAVCLYYTCVLEISCEKMVKKHANIPLVVVL